MSKQPTQDEINTFVNAATIGSVERVTEFLDKYPKAIDRKNASGEGALFQAAAYWKEDVVRLLLEKAADIETRNTRGVTPLITAARFLDPRNAGALRLLLDHDADIEAKDFSGRTAMDIAEEYKSSLAAEMIKKCQKQRAAEVKAQELAEDIADFSPALKRSIRATRPLCGVKP